MKRIAAVRTVFAVLGAWMLVFVPGPLLSAAQTVGEDFSAFAAGSDASPAWEPQSAAWEVVGGAYVGDNGVALWRTVPFASAITFGCDVTVLELGTGDWLTVGLGLYADENNYWALNLVATPEPGTRHRTEIRGSGCVAAQSGRNTVAPAAEQGRRLQLASATNLPDGNQPRGRHHQGTDS